MPNVLIPRPVLWKPPAGSAIDFTHPLGAGLVSCWPMNEGAGLNIQDVVGRSGKGTLTNGTTWNAGKTIGGLNFDGTDDYVDVDTANIWDFGTGDFAVAVWAYTNTSNTVDSLVRKDTTSARVFNLGVNELNNGSNSAGAITWGFFTGAAYKFANSSAGVFTVGTWHLVVVQRRNGVNMEIFLDGKFLTNASSTLPTAVQAIDSFTNNTWFGRRQLPTFEFPLDGKIDSVFIYGRSLSAAQIERMYREPYSMFRGPEVFRKYWILDVP